jgi:hypothetical protein
MAPALTTPRSDSIAAHLPDTGEARAQSLLAANVNPRTGLATDYLNHFNEAIMLLEMIPDMPECVEDFLTWQPRTYREHFEASNLKAQGLIIQAYEEAETALRVEFDRVVDAMTEILIAVSTAMRDTTQDKTRAILAEQTTGWIKPLLTLAGGLIHGSPDQADVDRIMEK